MKKFILFSTTILLVVIFFQTFTGFANKESDPSEKIQAENDGQNDFDLQVGKWKTHLKLLTDPLNDSDNWIEYEGISVVSKIWNGKANLVELTANGSAGYIEALSLRLYNPNSGQWSLNFANSRTGVMSTPAIGEFTNGRGEFYNQETFNVRSIFVRFSIIPVTTDSIRFEQSFSDDGGNTWELNWIAIDTR